MLIVYACDWNYFSWWNVDRVWIVVVVVVVVVIVVVAFVFT